MTFSFAYLVYAAVAVLAGLWARRQGYLGGASGPAIPDLIPGHPAINLALRAIVTKLLDPATQAAAAAMLHDAEIKLLATYRPEIAAKFPGLALLLDQLVAQPAKPAA